jgi:hypothetical protein
LFIDLSHQAQQQVEELTRIMGLVERDVMIFALQQLHDAKTGKCKVRYPIAAQAPAEVSRKRKRGAVDIDSEV